MPVAGNAVIRAGQRPVSALLFFYKGVDYEPRSKNPAHGRAAQTYPQEPHEQGRGKR